MKAKQIIGAAVIMIGMFLAICTTDGCRHEVIARLVGVALCAAGGFLGGYFANEEEDKEDPYIEE